MRKFYKKFKKYKNVIVVSGGRRGLERQGARAGVAARGRCSRDVEGGQKGAAETIWDCRGLRLWPWWHGGDKGKGGVG